MKNENELNIKIWMSREHSRLEPNMFLALFLAYAIDISFSIYPFIFSNRFCTKSWYRSETNMFNSL